METYAEGLPLSGWCNQSRPAFPPSLQRYRYPKSSFQFSSPSKAKDFVHSSECVHHSPTSSGSHSPTTKFELNPAAREFCPNRRKQTHNPLGGKLVAVAASFFQRAYGLNGQNRADHQTLKQEMMSLTGCSERAVYAVLYGSSYADLLGSLRTQVPGYVAQKTSEIGDFSALPFYNFDGNASTPQTDCSTASPTPSCPPNALSSTLPSPVLLPEMGSETDEPSKHYPALALLALVAMLPLTLLY